ncbi:MAG TPA: PVC-type heme-binding CxxCH protein [Gemmataceae bacterium]|nr:PVC-type heme-binding CxxCH protein [Gemmataceae bacterium]
MRALFLSLLGVLLAALPVLARDKPLPPRDAPRHMTLPQGFRATLFAGEPDVVQPIAFTIDDRGRLWVAECYSYPKWRTDGKPGKDRILIFEDRDGDGRFDTRKVFCDNLANVSGIQVGFGGVWVCATPNLLFIPDRDGRDKPDAPPQVVLDGWDLKAQHNVFNDLTWGPDGWLYGCNGIMSNSKVGKPGRPDRERVPINCGVWRYHPTRRVFEAVAHGTTNPWGLDFDDYGQMFITNCVIKHLWHVVPGAHFQRMYGTDLNPHVYGLMESCADHLHWAGGHWTTSRGGQGAHSDAGGGHAHVGCMVYLGDNWPDRYRNGVFMCNLHGNRVNHDTLQRHGSGYVAHHGRDFLLAHDPWFRGLALQYGPDGGVFISDWTDTGECHNNAEVDRSNGRIYKITHGRVAPWHGDVAKLSEEELVKCQLHKNDWHVRHARRVLQERAVAGKLSPDTRRRLRKILDDNPDVTRKLRAMWALHVTGGLGEKLLLELLGSPHETVRGWAIQLALEDKASAALRDKLATMAVNDAAPYVRLYLASGLQRLPPGQRWPIAEGLIRHGEDAGDANLSLMIWYAIEPLAQADTDRAVRLIEKANIPLVREYLARRVTPLARLGLPSLVRLLGRVDDPATQRDVLRGVQDALEGRRQVAMPRGWPDVYQKLTGSSETEVRERALDLAVLFGDEQALASLRKTLIDPKAATAARQHALQTLLYKKKPDLVPLLQTLVSDRGLRGPAIRGLAAYGDDATPRVILRRYASLTDLEKSDAIQTLASRPVYALALLKAVERGRVSRRDLSAFTVRQIMGLKDKQVDDKLAQVWGTIRPASQEKAALMDKYRTLLTPDYLKQADRSRGRLVFAQTCASCHRLFGEGGDIGPELTGSQRANLDYVLDNVLDPSAIVPQDYQVTVVETKDGRVLTGIIKQENDKTVTVQTQNERVIVPSDEIETRTKSSISMMPEGLLAKLSNEEVRDLVAYLASPAQVPLPKKSRVAR